MKDNVLFSDNKIVATIERSNNGIDTVPIDIRGKSIKLIELGWTPSYTIQDIVTEINS